MTRIAMLAAAVLAAGAWLRWSTVPVAAAYRIGRAMGGRHARQ
jgi:hypothetical protein